MNTRRRFLATLTSCGFVLFAHAHVGNHPSVHDTVSAVLDRLALKKSHAELRKLTAPQIEAFLTPEERQILGTEHVSFRVNTPVTVSVIRDATMGGEPFWLKAMQFKAVPLRLKIATQEFDVWRKDFAAGWIGLGVNSLSGGGEHYFVAITPRTAGERLEVTELYPGQLRLGTLKAGERPYVDREEAFGDMPDELAGQTLIRTERARRNDGRMLGVLLFTEHPSTRRPDHVILT